MAPLVSVIIPNYNHAPFLKQRIESVLNQTFQDFELIILDDYSTDHSKDIIEDYRNHPKIKCISYNETNSGSTFKQWQKGIELATGKYLWIAESDDYCELNFLKTGIENLTEHNSELFYVPSYSVDIYGNTINKLEWWYKDLDDKRWDTFYYNLTTDEINKFLIFKSTLVNASAIIFKNTPNILSLIKESTKFKYVGDWLFWLQYLQQAKSLVYSVSSQNYFRYHDNTTRSSKLEKRNNEILKIYNWICNNVLYKKNDKKLLHYFFEHHIIFDARKHIFKNIRLLLISDKSISFARELLIYYLKGIKKMCLREN